MKIDVAYAHELKMAKLKKVNTILFILLNQPNPE